ncbi:serine protease inhibitor-like [Rhopilema esculentum]|uniref:serine protease inhibitor-like n=1 Tax=Rhopilema esculentum TaxID=499914 RepID=UPI0031D2C0CB
MSKSSNMETAILIAVLCAVILPVHFVVSQDSEHSFYAANEFAVNFYCKLATVHNETENLLFSPLTTYTALGMLKAGSKTTTALQLENALNWQRFVDGYGTNNGDEAIKHLLTEVFAPLQPNNTLSVANKLWLQEYFCTVRCNDYIKRIEKNFNAGMEELNFVTHPEKSRQEINKWVAEKTNQKFQDLLPKESVDVYTRLVLTSAVHFKNLWKYSFDKKNTTMQDFTKYIGDRSQKVKVPMMHQQGVFRSYRSVVKSPYEVLDIPIVAELSMVIIMPKTNDLFRRMQKDLRFVDVDQMLQELYVFPPSVMEIYLPRFRISDKFDLKDSLKNMLGIKYLFSSQNADLSGITGYRGLFVTHAVHEAAIDVDEEGAQPASSDFDGVGPAKSVRSYFRVNKPFIFLIRHKPTHTILFMGCVMDPLA